LKSQDIIHFHKHIIFLINHPTTLLHHTLHFTSRQALYYLHYGLLCHLTTFCRPRVTIHHGLLEDIFTLKWTANTLPTLHIEDVDTEICHEKSKSTTLTITAIAVADHDPRDTIATILRALALHPFLACVVAACRQVPSHVLNLT